MTLSKFVRRTVALRILAAAAILLSVLQILDLLELEFGIAEQGDFLVLELHGSGRALEIEARGDFLGGVVHGVLHFNKIGFKVKIIPSYVL